MNIALGVTGCIAAYKAIEVMRGLQKSGASVQVILTRSAAQFVTPLTFEALSGRSVITDMFREEENREIQHIRLAQEIQLLVVAPATANILGKFAQGIADDFLSTLYLATPAPILLAPAMNVEMWSHPAVQSNVAILRSRGHEFVDPEPGMLACGMEGEGRLAEVEAIVSRAMDMLQPADSLSGLRVLVTAGPTVEDIDPVRFISNRSSGKMGFAVAQAARRRGADVILVAGPTQFQAPIGVQFVLVRSAEEMKDAVLRFFPTSDIVVKAAAVSDHRPQHFSPQKIKKTSGPTAIQLTPNVDILALLGKHKERQILVGFAAESENLLERAKEKLVQKRLDLIVANDVSNGIFGADTATVHILSPDGEQMTMSQQSKISIANRILDMAHAAHLAQRSPEAAR